MATDQQILDGEIVNAPRGRFATPRARAEALYLNEGGWFACENNHWHDTEPGEACMDCGKPARRERRPDKDSVFEQVYARFVNAKRHHVCAQTADTDYDPSECAEMGCPICKADGL
jgi:hypothetical protein